MRFDWKDGLLVALGFATFAALLGVARHLGFDPGTGTLQFAAATALLGPSSLRRYLFGPPVLGKMRKGLVASLVSIVGLLALFSGIGVAVVSVHRVTQREPAPDFEAEVASWEADTLEFEVTPVGETAAEAEARRDRARAERAAERERSIAERAQEWSAAEAEQRRLDLILAAVALLLLGGGSLALWSRYEPAPRT